MTKSSYLFGFFVIFISAFFIIMRVAIGAESSEPVSTGWQLGFGVYELLAPLLTALIGYVSVKLSSYLKTKTKNEYLAGILSRLNHSVFSAVKKVNQTLLDEIKKAKSPDSDGGTKITKEESSRLKDAVWLELKKEYGGMMGIIEFLKVLGLDDESVESFIDTRIEAAVHDIKATNPTRPVN